MCFNGVPTRALITLNNLFKNHLSKVPGTSVLLNTRMDAVDGALDEDVVELLRRPAWTQLTELWTRTSWSCFEGRSVLDTLNLQPGSRMIADISSSIGLPHSCWRRESHRSQTCCYSRRLTAASCSQGLVTETAWTNRSLRCAPFLQQRLPRRRSSRLRPRR